MPDTLLLIEDEPLLSGELVRHFRREGFEVLTAGSLAQAKRLIVQDDVQPLVVISDMSLPDGNAYDFLEKPCELDRLDLVVAGALRSARAQRQLREQAAAENRRYAPAAFVGRSEA